MGGIGPGREWLFDVVGGAVGSLVGLIAAVNLVIYAGVERGYEASIVDVFDHSALVGVVASALPVAGLVGGVVIARRHRRER